MNFLYPLFLWAGLSLAIPFVIHLFNLRRYKTFYFPHTRFLKAIQLRSQKQNELQYKLLLALRMLFLAFLVFAFAQPYFKEAIQEKASSLQVIYIDNSYSMSLKTGERTLLDIAREKAAQQVRQAPPGTRFLLLTNDKPESLRPEPASKIFNQIHAVGFSPSNSNMLQTLAITQNLKENNGETQADLYAYSDYQKCALPAMPTDHTMKGIHFYGICLMPEKVNNISIDTAYLTMPSLQAGKPNALVVASHIEGSEPREAPVLQLLVNGKVSAVASVSYKSSKQRLDTLRFQTAGNGGWQQLQVALSNGWAKYDDTFRLAVRSAAGISVLVLNEGKLNPYLQASFRAFEGFRINEADAGTPPPATEWGNYQLIVLNGATRIDTGIAHHLQDALQQGKNVLILPGKTSNTDALNKGLQTLADLRIDGIDTTLQPAASLQQGSALVKDIFEKIPDNVQLPSAQWHYALRAGITANQQSILSFRNGDPMLARYTPAVKGSLYVAAMSADPEAGNLQSSYFFTPFLYLMAIQSSGSNLYAIEAGSKQPIFVPQQANTERGTMHLYAPGTDLVPPQQPAGTGTEVYVAQAVQQPGFYALASKADDTTTIALNLNRQESNLTYYTIDELKQQWKAGKAQWSAQAAQNGIAINAPNSLPLWKIAIAIALLMLAIETYLLATRGNRKMSVVEG